MMNTFPPAGNPARVEELMEHIPDGWQPRELMNTFLTAGNPEEPEKKKLRETLRMMIWMRKLSILNLTLA